MACDRAKEDKLASGGAVRQERKGSRVSCQALSPPLLQGRGHGGGTRNKKQEESGREIFDGDDVGWWCGIPSLWRCHAPTPLWTRRSDASCSMGWKNHSTGTAAPPPWYHVEKGHVLVASKKGGGVPLDNCVDH